MILLIFFLFLSVLSQNKCQTKVQLTNNFDIGVDLPWLKTDKHIFTKIPKYLLVEINFSNKKIEKNTYVCRVNFGNNIKIIGKVSYITNKFIYKHLNFKC